MVLDLRTLLFGVLFGIVSICFITLPGLFLNLAGLVASLGAFSSAVLGGSIWWSGKAPSEKEMHRRIMVLITIGAFGVAMMTVFLAVFVLHYFEVL